MEPISSFTETITQYFPQDLPSVEKIMGIVRKEFNRIAPLLVKNISNYKIEICLSGLCTVLLIAYIRRSQKQIEKTPPSPPLSHCESSDSEEELDLEPIPDDESDGSPKSSPRETPSEVPTPGGDGFVDPTSYQPNGTLSDSLLFRLAELESLVANPQAREVEKAFSAVERMQAIKDVEEHLKPKFTFASTNQFKSGGGTACTYCATMFLSRTLFENSVDVIFTTKWLTQLIEDAIKLYKASKTTAYVDFLDVQAFCRKLRVGEFPVVEPPTRNENYVDTMMEISLQEPVVSYNNAIQHHLDRNRSGLLLIINNYTCALAKIEGYYYVFDSHGGQHATQESSNAFVGRFSNSNDLAVFLSILYPPHQTDEAFSLDELALEIAELENKNENLIQEILIKKYPNKAAIIRAAFPSTYQDFEQKGLLNHPNNIKLLIAWSLQFSLNAAMLTPLKYASE